MRGNLFRFGGVALLAVVAFGLMVSPSQAYFPYYPNARVVGVGSPVFPVAPGFVTPYGYPNYATSTVFRAPYPGVRSAYNSTVVNYGTGVSAYYQSSTVIQQSRFGPVGVYTFNSAPIVVPTVPLGPVPYFGGPRLYP
jgi:hypothetical protein